ncbi:MAG: hypothetical protein J1E16_00680 [Muribaculaceae bacterium]|nr:hypothetical protein [Muribaculaceae bacterium]
MFKDRFPFLNYPFVSCYGNYYNWPIENLSLEIEEKIHDFKPKSLPQKYWKKIKYEVGTFRFNWYNEKHIEEEYLEDEDLKQCKIIVNFYNRVQNLLNEDIYQKSKTFFYKDNIYFLFKEKDLPASSIKLLIDNLIDVTRIFDVFLSDKDEDGYYITTNHKSFTTNENYLLKIFFRKFEEQILKGYTEHGIPEAKAMQNEIDDFEYSRRHI